jgi:hypothetical protein
LLRIGFIAGLAAIVVYVIRLKVAQRTGARLPFGVRPVFAGAFSVVLLLCVGIAVAFVVAAGMAVS